MNVEIFVGLCDYLEKEVPELRWIDEDEGQLNTQQGARPPVDYPCCLIDINYPNCQDITETEQIVTCSITLKIAFQPIGETNNKAPQYIRNRALERLSIVEKVHTALQGWSANGKISPVSRRSARPSALANRVKLYTVVYDTTFEEI